MKRDGIQKFSIVSQILGSKIFYYVQIACMQREIVEKTNINNHSLISQYRLINQFISHG